MDDLTNLVADIPGRLPEELFQTILAKAHFRVERIVSLGHASPEGVWCDQDEHEWVLLVKGAARLRFDGDEAAVEMKPGSFINIPARKRHRVEWAVPSQPTVWLAIHYRDEM